MSKLSEEVRLCWWLESGLRAEGTEEQTWRERGPAAVELRINAVPSPLAGQAYDLSIAVSHPVLCFG